VVAVLLAAIDTAGGTIAGTIPKPAPAAVVAANPIHRSSSRTDLSRT
jgi:hypothetical protein